MKDDMISRQAALNSPVKMVSDGLEWVPLYHIKELPSAQPVNIAKLQPNCNQVASDCASDCASHCASDCISRQEAINALGEEPPVWYDGEDELAERYQWRRDVAAIKALPPAQPTLYGYDIKHLAFIASIMAKKGVSPEEAVIIFRDVNRVIEMMLEDMKEMQENALKQALKRPWEGGQDE